MTGHGASARAAHGRWTAIVPFNHGGAVKTRLGPVLDEAARNALAMAMARHVVAVLDAAPSIGAIWVVAPNDPALAPAGWIADGACGLNAEIAAARAVLGDGPALLIHADLPLLSVEDVEALVAAADDAGAAIAPDIAQTGTNAIALADGRAFAPAFGVDSFARHRAVLGDAAIVRREGLSRDIDEPNTIHFVPPHSLDSDPRSANGGGKDRQGG